MLLLTTDLNGKQLTEKEVIGIVTASSIRGSNFTKDYMGKFKDFFGGKVKGYEEDLETTKHEAIAKMIKIAEEHSATAIIGIRVDVATLPMDRGGLYVCTATGTAIKKV